MYERKSEIKNIEKKLNINENIKKNKDNVNLSEYIEIFSDYNFVRYKRFTPKEFVKYALKKLEKDGIFYNEKDKTIYCDNVTINEKYDILKRILNLYSDLRVKNYSQICSNIRSKLLSKDYYTGVKPIMSDENFYDEYKKNIKELKSPIKENTTLRFGDNDGEFIMTINTEETDKKKKRNFELLKAFNTKEADKCAFILTTISKCLNKVKEKDGKFEFENIDFLTQEKEKLKETENINSITKEAINMLNSLSYE